MKFVLSSEFFFRLCSEDRIFFVGTTQGSECLLDKFAKEGVWEIYAASDLQKKSLSEMHPGMVIVAKGGLGRGNKDIRIKGAGIILSKAEPILDACGRPTEDYRVNVSWVLPSFTKNIPSKGRYGAIHDGLVGVVGSDCKEIVLQTKTRFLKTYCCNVVDSEVVF